jgi:hypothetical protein
MNTEADNKPEMTTSLREYLEHRRFHGHVDATLTGTDEKIVGITGADTRHPNLRLVRPDSSVCYSNNPQECDRTLMIHDSTQVQFHGVPR